MGREEETAENYEPRIEPYYQARAKNLVDTLFDLGCLSESLSRDGITRIENLVALFFQQTADATARCAQFTKKYKQTGEEHERHEEEMRWIARAQEAEKEIRQRNEILAGGAAMLPTGLTPWHKDIVNFLRDTLEPPYCVDVGFASRLLNEAIELGIACKPGERLSPCPK